MIESGGVGGVGSEEISKSGFISGALSEAAHPQYENNVGTEVATGVVVSSSALSNPGRRQMISQEMQTKIGGVGNRLLISPKDGTGPIYGGSTDGCRFKDEDSADSDEGSIQRKKMLQA